MKIFLIADFDSDWYPKNAVLNFKKHSGITFVDEPEDSDLIWIFSDYMPLDRLFSKNLFRSTTQLKRSLESKPILASFHHFYEPKKQEFIERITKVDKLTHFIHFFSKPNVLESQQYFTKPIFVLPYWIDPELFFPMSTEEKSSLRQRLELPPNKRIIGSFQRDTEVDLTTPKFEKGPDRLCNILQEYQRHSPDELFVLLSGPRRDYVEKRLKKIGIPFRSLGKIEHHKMNELYNAIDLYLVTSRCEGGPQAILECMASQTPIFSTNVGIANLLTPEARADSLEAFVEKLTHPYPQTALHTHFETSQQFHSKKIIPQYETKLTTLKKKQSCLNID